MKKNKFILWDYTCYYCGWIGSPDHKTGHKDGCPNMRPSEFYGIKLREFRKKMPVTPEQIMEELDKRFVDKKQLQLTQQKIFSEIEKKATKQDWDYENDIGCLMINQKDWEELKKKLEEK